MDPYPFQVIPLVYVYDGKSYHHWWEVADAIEADGLRKAKVSIAGLEFEYDIDDPVMTHILSENPLSLLLPKELYEGLKGDE